MEQAAPYLPNEVWFLIAEYCEPKDIWLSLRQVSPQLQQCADQYFERTYLPDMTITLPIALPTYDIRNPIRGKALFKPNPVKGQDQAASDRVVFSLANTDPAHYHSHFVGRWKAMCDRNAGGWLKESTKWEMHLCGRHGFTRLKNAQGITASQVSDDHAQLSFDWKASITSFYR